MQAIEIITVALEPAGVVWLRPKHADSFIVGWPAGERPEEIATKALDALGIPAAVLHSTSWRHATSEVVLTYLAVVKAGMSLPESWEAAPVLHTDLARGDAISPPPVIGVGQVLEHALRHLAWLVKEDKLVGEALPGWADALGDYIPEPFRAFGPA